MKIILATSNKGKIKEIKALFKNIEVIPYTDLIDKFEIIEDGLTFKENAIIKVKAVFNKLNTDDIILSDDSGISIEALKNRPNIYSARYAGVNATDKDNVNKVISELKDLNIKQSKAYYSVCIAIATKKGIETVHSWMYGKVIDNCRGDKGFGYDPIFIPNGFDKTLGELDINIKEKLSHRSKALQLATILITSKTEKRSLSYPSL